MLVSIIIIYFLPSCLLLPLLPATPPATPLSPYSCFFLLFRHVLSNARILQARHKLKSVVAISSDA
jgi:hypothetical protein